VHPAIDRFRIVGIADSVRSSRKCQTNDIVIELKAQIIGEGIDAIEPMIETVEEIRVGAVLLQLLARDRMAAARGGDPASGACKLESRRHPRLWPNVSLQARNRVLHPGDVGDEAAFLQIAARQGAVEIIDNGGAQRRGLAVGCIRH
jgi:hypothetical protein